ncbi:hypothetical protein AMJ52_07690 [candidate division TA06 bacterium DG_78]|uniref:Lipoprotein n=1 Tax=candidate division TA06 bacterium DG_78 TaxID=1703772 RepID=A0A0S7YBE9_UNCT6|nr:MAG: hypothetical protein AMJ52_07690 [candidate division TA06 bacterium DG_78]
MKKWILLLLSIVFFVSCEGDASLPKHTPQHEVEQIALNFVRDVKNNVYTNQSYYFVADSEFIADDREFYFRRLEKFIKNNAWDLYFTAIDIYDGQELTSDVILRAKSGDIVIFCVNYWNDTQRWELDAYEFPGLTFYRPDDQSYEDYVKQLIAEAKDVGVEYSQRQTIGNQGTYYIEYQ